MLILIINLVILHVANNTGSEEVKAWFRQNREERFGVTLEQFAGEPTEVLAALKKVLVPIHSFLKENLFMTGDKGKVVHSERREDVRLSKQATKRYT